jgi:Flp pilus assembly protein TadG
MQCSGAQFLISVRQSFAKWAKSCNGATAVETAIVLPAFLLLIFAIVEAGRIFWTQSSLQYAVEAAARCAAVNTTLCGSTSSIQTYAAAQAVGVNVSSSSFNVSLPSCGHQISISYSFTLVVTELFPGGITLKAQSCHP